MRSVRARSVALLSALALLGALPGASVLADAGTQAVVSKSCRSGYTHAVLPSGHKCLRVGQFCARRYNRYYHRYGFHCKRNRHLKYY
jgi:hypothetical protein